MIARAHAQITQLPFELRSRIRLMQGDATRFVSTTPFDAVTSLFHVINYETTNDALNGIFQSARAALAVDGIFIFDFWLWASSGVGTSPGPRKAYRRGSFL